MLKKDRISKIEMLSDEWRVARLGNFTSSEIHKLMGDKEFSTGAMSYIYTKVGEELAGVSAIQDINFDMETDSMRWGKLHEETAVRIFGKQKGLDYLIVQQLIVVPDTRFGSTPDALIVHNESIDGTAFNVSTVEVKCFPTFTSYIPLLLCNTPQEIKAQNNHLYWQVLDQMDNCDCLIGYSACYHPSFKAGNFKSVEFKKVDLYKDINLLKERKRLAVEKFDEVRSKLIAMGKF